jgi:protein SDA1
MCQVLESLHDPGEFAERLLLSLRRWGGVLRFEHKLLMIDLIARVMATHRIVLLEFYDWMLRYLTPQQLELHQLLAALATSVSPLTPPDAVLSLVCM